MAGIGDLQSDVNFELWWRPGILYIHKILTMAEVREEEDMIRT